jgi:hypothetical protein
MGLFTGKASGTLDWTHQQVKIQDIRLFNKLYVIYITDTTGAINTPLFINRGIFEDRLNSYFLGKNCTREEILALQWNMYITKDYYIKVDGEGNINKIPAIKDKWYVSYLDVTGYLGEFSFVYKNEIIKKTSL